MRLPVFAWLGGYDRRWLAGDVVAGLTVWAVLVPEALVRDEIRSHVTGDTHAIVLDAASVASIDVTAVTMLVDLAEDLRRDGVQLALARDIAAVRDLVRLQESDVALRSYPSVQAAVDELTKRA